MASKRGAAPPIISKTDKQAMRVRLSLDGMDYEVNLGDLTGREMALIRSAAPHVRGLMDIALGLEGVDLQVLIGLTAVGMRRAGHEPDVERMLDLPLDAFAAEEIADGADPTKGEPTPEPPGDPS